jgi:hypothetical protein
VVLITAYSREIPYAGEAPFYEYQSTGRWSFLTAVTGMAALYEVVFIVLE